MTAPLSLVHTIREPAPGSNPAGARPPLLLHLHGVGSNERSMASLAPAFDPRFLVVSARSPLTLGLDAFGWFHVTFSAEGPVINGAEAAAGWAHVARFIDETVRAYGADAARVYLAGFSQGGIMALATLLTSPERIAGAVTMSGRLLPEVLPHTAPVASLREKPLLILHGVADEVLGVHFARDARKRLASLPIALTYEEFPMGHQVTPESLAAASSWLTALLDRAPAPAPVRL